MKRLSNSIKLFIPIQRYLDMTAERLDYRHPGEGRDPRHEPIASVVNSTELENPTTAGIFAVSGMPPPIVGPGLRRDDGRRERRI